MSESNKIDFDQLVEKSCPLCARSYTGTEELFCTFDGRALTTGIASRANVDIHSTAVQQSRIDHQY